MFSSCSSLSSLDLSNFITSSVNNMRKMFSDCTSLLSLDLSNFDTSKVNKMENIFYNCKSLIALNLLNFNTSNVNTTNDMFAYCNESLIYCINTNNLKEEIASQLTNYLNNDCSNVCFLEYHKIILEERKCIAMCNYSNYKYEYNGLCYETCPEGTYVSSNNINICKELLSEVIDNTFFTDYINNSDYIKYTDYINNNVYTTYIDTDSFNSNDYSDYSNFTDLINNTEYINYINNSDSINNNDYTNYINNTNIINNNDYIDYTDYINNNFIHYSDSINTYNYISKIHIQLITLVM